ncbi:GNAT family N-acetyltransferase [Frankia gtarii]|uniref:GNAT family N-acetyltransferase n=1 Tax=Frankia gtarii TaxID=2950102 RepID=UPI0021BF3CA9|nr:acetyltransferase [Frankia gtarii]
MRTRRASPEDWDTIWPVWRAVVIEGETCPWEPDTGEETARAVWMRPPPAAVLVMEQDAASDEGLDDPRDEGLGATTVVATALLTPSLPGLGDHVVQATLLVDPKRIDQGGPRAGSGQYDDHGPYGGTASPTRGRAGGHWESVSRQAAEEMIEYATDLGYQAMQVHVVAANPRLVSLWRSLAFRQVGTLPAAFRHPWLGNVDLYVMYRFLPPRER